MSWESLVNRQKDSKSETQEIDRIFAAARELAWAQLMNTPEARRVQSARLSKKKGRVYKQATSGIQPLLTMYK